MPLADNFRTGMRRLAAGVCVISTKVESGRYAMTASSVTSLSDEPPSLLVCVNVEAAIQTHLRRGVPFAVSVLSYEQQAISNLCAQKEAGDERFAIDGWAEYEENELPYIADAQAVFICEVDSDDMMYGTHQIVVGKLKEVIMADGPVQPLIYADGAYQYIAQAKD